MAGKKRSNGPESEGQVKKPMKKPCLDKKCSAKPMKKSELNKKEKRTKKLAEGTKKVGSKTVGIIRSSGHVATHPKIVIKKTKDGVGAAKSGAERISGADGAETKQEYYRKLLIFFGPLVLLLVLYGSYFLIFPWHQALKLVGAAAAYMFMIPPGVDKTTLILSANRFDINPYQMAFNIWIIDSLLGTFLCLNFDYAKKLPLAGKRIAVFEKLGRQTLRKHSWLKRFATIGLFLFIVLPFQGSGALAGSIVGRIIGMKTWRVLIAVIGGTFTSVMVLAYSADLMERYFPLEVRIAVPIIIFLTIITGMIIAYRKKKAKEKDLRYQLYIKEKEEELEQEE